MITSLLDDTVNGLIEPLRLEIIEQESRKLRIEVFKFLYVSLRSIEDLLEL